LPAEEIAAGDCRRETAAAGDQVEVGELHLTVTVRAKALALARQPMAQEIIFGRADFVVERRGFELMAIAGAGRSRATPLFAIQRRKASSRLYLLDRD
jgi:hypothetical protein